MDITLDELLAARDHRAAYEADLRRRFPGACLVVFTVVAPGPDKRTADARRLFDAGITALAKLLMRFELAPLLFEALESPAGDAAYLALRSDAYFLKSELCKLEQSAPYGRLWDMDVLDPAGRRVERERVGYAERACVVCGKPGRGCASRRLHPLDEVLAAAHTLADTLPET